MMFYVVITITYLGFKYILKCFKYTYLISILLWDSTVP